MVSEGLQLNKNARRVLGGVSPSPFWACACAGLVYVFGFGYLLASLFSGLGCVFGFGYLLASLFSGLWLDCSRNVTGSAGLIWLEIIAKH